MATTEFKISGVLWTAPAGVTSVSVDCIGGGGSGDVPFGGSRRSAAGGGAWSQNPSYTVIAGNNYTYSIGVCVLGSAGGDTSFDSGGVLAKGGHQAIINESPQGGGLGGAAGSGTGTNKNSGGNGGYQSGAGGAAGPNGNGTNATRYGGNGGSGDAGFGGAGGSSFGAAGSAGTEYDATHGSGGGGAYGNGGGGGVSDGGLYGGAGGATLGGAPTQGGTGAQGLIVLVYTSGGGFTNKIRRELTQYGTRVGSRQMVNTWL